MFRIFRSPDHAMVVRLLSLAAFASVAIAIAAGPAGASTAQHEETAPAVEVASAAGEAAIPVYAKGTIEIVPPLDDGSLGLIIYRFEESPFVGGLRFGGPR